MNGQRFIVFLVAIAGIIATFLPWYDIALMGTITGLSSSGWFTFIMFILVLFIAMRKNPQKDMPNGTIWTISFLSVLASVVVLWRVLDIYFSQDAMLALGGKMQGIMGNEVTIRYGAWIVVFAGFSIPLIAFIFRKKKTILEEKYE